MWQTIILAISSRKLHEIEENYCTERGASPNVPVVIIFVFTYQTLWGFFFQLQNF